MFRQITVITNVRIGGQRASFTIQFCEDVKIENGDLTFRGYNLRSKVMEDFIFPNCDINTILINND